MSLNSYVFFLFFFLIFILYYTVCKRRQKELLITASILFILCYSPFCLALLLFVTVSAYGASCLIDRKRSGGKKYAIICTVLFLGILAVFKYLMFGVDMWNRMATALTGNESALTLPLQIILPVGISFYIFQNIGYIWDVYKGRVPAEKGFAKYLLFTSYFPKFTVGPIERAEGFLPQIHQERHEFSYDNAVAGLRIVMIGMFKKIAVADVLAPVVNKVFDNPGEYTGLPLVIATILYTFQIYCDFSGYADLAIGYSKMLGIDLMQNFHSPYFSKSISEFWRRWHISLSSWFRDFVYIPLGGNRVGKMRHMFNTMVTFILSGLWHGASLNFLAWGGVHGALLCIENGLNRGRERRQKASHRGKINSIAKRGLTFACVSVAWVFFRANSLRGAVYIITHYFSQWQFNISYVKTSFVSMGFTELSCVVALVSLSILVVIDWIQCKRPISEVLGVQKPYIRWGVYFLFLFYILFCKMYMAESQQFIYFQF